MEKLRKRQEVPKEDTWDLEAIYPNLEAWEKDFAAVKDGIPALAQYQGRLGESADVLFSFLRRRDDLSIILEQLLVYAYRRRDEDTTVSRHQGMADRVSTLASQCSAAIAFVRPEILALAAETLERWLAEHDGLSEYAHYLRDMMREKEHVRSAEVEVLLAQMGDLARAPGEIFDMLNDADLKFPVIRDESGKEIELTQGRWGRFRESKDRRVRKDAYEALYSAYRSHRHTAAATLGAHVKKNVFYARARKFDAVLDMVLHANNVPATVYHSLISTVHANLDALHRYMRLRKRLLGVETLHHYDLYVPIVPDTERAYPWQESVETVLAACAPLGESYVSIAREGFAQRWADVYENEGKSSGAYSSGSYTTYPYMLLNHQDNIESLYTLAHELGHSMHSYFTRKNQPYIYGDYTIFVAEVASTLNEALLTDYLVKTSHDEAFKLYLVNRHLESIRTTLYRQTMFAEFELAIHTMAEREEPLTVDALCELYSDLNKKYYGPDVVPDEDIALEWSRIPHFYMNYYVYQYATGISAAEALSQQVLTEGAPAVERYLRFLGSGSSDYSIELLRRAGVDMASPAPVQSALQVFAGLVDQMEQLTGS